MADWITENILKQNNPAGWDWQLPAQKGTNLPGAVTSKEARSGRMPTWNGALPSDVLRKASGAVPIYTGKTGEGGYGGNIQYFDPSTGRFYTEHGFIKDNQLTSASPDIRAQLAARAASNPGGMLTPADFAWAQMSMGQANPNQNAESAARKAAAGYAGYAGQPGYQAPTAPIASHWAQSRYQQALRNGKPLQDPRMQQYVQQRGLTPPSAATRLQPTGQGPIQYPTDPRQSGAPTMPTGMQDPLQQMLATLLAGRQAPAMTSAGGLGAMPMNAAGSAWGGGQAQGYNLLSMLLQGLMQRGGLPSM